MRKAIATLLKLSKAELLSFLFYGNTVRGPCTLCIENFVDSLKFWKPCRRFVPLFHDLAYFLIREQRQLRNSHASIEHSFAEKSRPMFRHANDCGLIEKVCAVVKAREDRVGTLVELEIQIVFRRTRIDIHLRQLPSRVDGWQRRFEGKHHLEQRVSAEISRSIELMNQLPERNAIVIESFECHVSYAS